MNIKTYAEFKDFVKDDILIKGKFVTNEQFCEIMKPIMCDLCRRIFNPTKEEKEEARKRLNSINEIFPDDFTWELIIKH
jgi:hypothetical protein